jgi:hypothetical protein
MMGYGERSRDVLDLAWTNHGTHGLVWAASRPSSLK